MTICSPSTKLLAVVHVGLLSGVVQTAQQELTSNKHQLNGAALDVCRQTMSKSTSTTELYTVVVTKDAVDDDAGGSQMM